MKGKTKGPHRVRLPRKTWWSTRQIKLENDRGNSEFTLPEIHRSVYSPRSRVKFLKGYLCSVLESRFTQLHSNPQCDIAKPAVGLTECVWFGVCVCVRVLTPGCDCGRTADWLNPYCSAAYCGCQCHSTQSELMAAVAYQQVDMARIRNGFQKYSTEPLHVKWPCCADLYASLLALFSAGDWMGLSTVVSNLCHLDECVPVPRLFRPNRSFSKLQTRLQRTARIEPLAYSTGTDNRQDSSRLSVRRFHTFPKFQSFLLLLEVSQSVHS